MKKIEVAVLHESHEYPAGMMMFLAKLTQRGHNIKNMSDLQALYQACIDKDVKHPTQMVMQLPHGTIKRFTPITLAIVGASRRFLAQARTHQIGLNFVSASLQYSDYSGKADFVVPYELLKPERAIAKDWYLKTCNDSMKTYEDFIADGISNDTAGYAAPQGLRNILIVQGNHESLLYFIRTRACKRNTEETKFVTTLMWQELLKTTNGEDMFAFAGPDCMYGKCREGKMSCGVPFKNNKPVDILESTWPEVFRNVE